MRKLSARLAPSPTLAFTLVMAGFLAPISAQAHDIELAPKQIAKDVRRIADTLRFYQERTANEGVPRDAAEQRRALGAAEIDLALGDTQGALQILMGRLADPAFQALPEYVGTLLMTSEILETQAEDVGAMLYAEQALRRGGTPEQMAEAGARWFRLARRNQRMDGVLDILSLWRAKGGAQAAGTETAAQVMYQAAFAMRQQNQRAEARAFLGRVPSNSAFGSRAAYLAGVLYVEEGNLAQAERWLAAIMDWGVLADEGTTQFGLERQVRDLAALSTARLRYERGDLEAADAAYRRIGEGSPFQREACWERAYLDLERGKKRGALKRMQCVVDLGARGGRAADARLFEASLLAHMNQYDASIDSYEKLHGDLVEERDLFVQAITQLGERPAEFLFASMERGAASDAEGPISPGPATLFADAWTPQLDQAYRVDRSMDHAAADLGVLMAEIQTLATTLRDGAAMAGFELRKRSLEVLLKEIRHLEGHGRQVLEEASRSHASVGGAVDHDHSEARVMLKGQIEHLQVLGTTVEAEIVAVDRDAIRRKQEALTMLRELLGELQAIERDLEGLQRAGDTPINGVARQALGKVRANLDDAAMRAEFGVLDTFWLKKQHRTRAIETLLQTKKETERQVLDAIEDLSK